MKTIYSRFLKAAVAMLLVVVMLFGSTISGLAAVVDNAQTKANVDLADTEASVDIAETGATKKYIYCGISNTYQSKKTEGEWGFNFWGGTDGGVKSPNHVQDGYNWDGRNYTIYRVQVYDDNNKAQIKVSNSWWDPGSGFSISLTGTTKNAIFFSNNDDGWGGQFTENYQVASNVALDASATTVNVGTSVTLSPKLTSNTYYNTIKTTTYSINPSTGASVSNGKFTATKAGTYTVTANITYNAQGFTGITKTASATKTITVNQPKTTITLNKDGGTGGTTTVTGTYGANMTTISVPTKTGYTFGGYFDAKNGSGTQYYKADGTYKRTWNKSTTTATLYAKWIPNSHTVNITIDPTEGGTVKINGTPGISANVDYDSTLELEADPKDGYRFVGWYEGTTEKSTESTYSFQVKGNVSLKAVFEKLSCNVTAKIVDPKGNALTSCTVSGTGEFQYGAEYSLTAKPATGYRFVEWQLDDESVGTDATISGTATKDLEYTAVFAKQVTVTIQIPENITAVNLNGKQYLNNATVTVDAGVEYTATALSKAGYKVVNWKVDGTELTPANHILTQEFTGNEIITPVATAVYYVNVLNGISAIGTGLYAAGEPVLVTINEIENYYLNSCDVKAGDASVDAEVNKAEGTISFVMPESNVDITARFNKYSHIIVENSASLTVTGIVDKYLGGQVLGQGLVNSIVLAPKNEHVTINGVTFEVDGEAYDGLTATKNTNGSYTITGTIPAEKDVKIIPDVDVECLVDVEVIGIGNYGTNDTYYGTISLKSGSTNVDKNTYIAQGTPITFFLNGSGSKFDFIGYYSDEKCTEFLSAETSYTLNITKDTKIYALFARKHYVTFDNNTSNHVTMTYDRQLGAYTATTASLGKEKPFRVTNQLNGWSDDHSYNVFPPEEFSVGFNGNSYLVACGWADKSWQITDDSTRTGGPYTLLVTPRGNESIDVSVRATKNDTKHRVFLSNGRDSIGGASTTVTTEGISKGTLNTAAHDNDKETYYKFDVAEGTTLTWKTTLGVSDKDNKYVECFLAYNIEDRTYTIIDEPQSDTKYEYNGSYTVNSDTYIVPIFFYDEKWVEATTTGKVAIDMYFDASAIKGLEWGPLVSCYGWGDTSDKKEYKYWGSWPGQLLIPTADGKSFYTQMVVDKSTKTNRTIPDGVTFNNYMYGSCPNNEPASFGLKSYDNIQTYDYREPITLYDGGYEVITFVAKKSKDGYHGDHANGVKVNWVGDQKYDKITEKFKFDYLYKKDGITPMDLNGNVVENPKSVTAADYYIVAEGDVYYSNHYVGDSAYDGKWSVDWHIYDSAGNRKTSILSTALWHDLNLNDTSKRTYLHQALGLQPEDVAGKTVAISYEEVNDYDISGHPHNPSYDGQWYGEMLSGTTKAEVKVGLEENGRYQIDDDDTPNNAKYGEAYLVDIKDGYKQYQTLDVSNDYGKVDLTATAKNDGEDVYRFIGWYTKVNGKYVRIAQTPQHNANLNNYEVYYAMFKKVESTTVIVNHMLYENKKETAITSHGGKATMWLELIDSKTQAVIKTSDKSDTLSQLVIENAVNNKQYTVRIHTVPLFGGEFFAWYTNSKFADGTDTFEEIITDADGTNGSNIGSTTECITEYTFTYTHDYQRVVNIYSDVTKKSQYATYVYEYINRFGQPRWYNVEGVELTEDEMKGYKGNGGKGYYPSHVTKYIMKNMGNNTEKVAWGDKEKQQAYAEGYTYEYSHNNDTLNRAPKEKVTQVFDGTVAWIVSDDKLSVQHSYVKLTATQDVPLYDFHYTIDGETTSLENPVRYNTLIQIEAPAENKEGVPFSHWEEKHEDGTQTFLTYYRNYNYRIVEEKHIVAVYDEEADANWVPSIDSVVYTREFGDGGDYIYTDFLLAYNSKEGKELNVVKAEEGIKYGLIMVQKPDYKYTGTGDVDYVDISDSLHQNNIKTVAMGGKSLPLNGYSYYCYDLTAKNLTNLNRIDYFKKYDNNYVSTKYDAMYRNYAFTCVAYMIVDGEVILSDNQAYVNFYTVANENIARPTT